MKSLIGVAGFFGMSVGMAIQWVPFDIIGGYVGYQTITAFSLLGLAFFIGMAINHRD